VGVSPLLVGEFLEQCFSNYWVDATEPSAELHHISHKEGAAAGVLIDAFGYPP